MWFSSIATLAAAVVALLARDVVGHGYVRQHLLDGVYYTGYLPYDDPDFTLDAPSIVRKIFDIGPIKTPLEKNITCSETAVPVNRTGPVTAGSEIQFLWSEWPHNGPIFTYMARCTNDDCSTFYGDSDPVWFKIDDYGYDNTTGDWATQVLFDNNNTWISTVPACLEPGQYLVRHEIISVSEAYKEGGCQFYPSCAQVTVVGNGTVNPTDLVSFPGAYQPDDPGILFNTNAAYTYYPLPGPAVFQCPE